MGPKKKTLAPPPGQASIHTFFGKSPDLTKKAPPAAHAPESNGEDKAKGGQTPLIKAKSPTKPKSKTETKDENTKPARLNFDTNTPSTPSKSNQGANETPIKPAGNSGKSGKSPSKIQRSGQSPVKAKATSSSIKKSPTKAQSSMSAKKGPAAHSKPAGQPNALSMLKSQPSSSTGTKKLVKVLKKKGADMTAFPPVAQPSQLPADLLMAAEFFAQFGCVLGIQNKITADELQTAVSAGQTEGVLAELHLALLRSILGHEEEADEASVSERAGRVGRPSEDVRGRHEYTKYMNEYTWPGVMQQFFERSLHAEVRSLGEHFGRSDYWDVEPVVRLEALRTLCDESLGSPVVRSWLNGKLDETEQLRRQQEEEIKRQKHEAKASEEGARLPESQTSIEAQFSKPDKPAADCGKAGALDGGRKLTRMQEKELREAEEERERKAREREQSLEEEEARRKKREVTIAQNKSSLRVDALGCDRHSSRYWCLSKRAGLAHALFVQKPVVHSEGADKTGSDEWKMYGSTQEVDQLMGFLHHTSVHERDLKKELAPRLGDINTAMADFAKQASSRAAQVLDAVEHAAARIAKKRENRMRNRGEGDVSDAIDAAGEVAGVGCSGQGLLMVGRKVFAQHADGEFYDAQIVAVDGDEVEVEWYDGDQAGRMVSAGQVRSQAEHASQALLTSVLAELDEFVKDAPDTAVIDKQLKAALRKQVATCIARRACAEDVRSCVLQLSALMKPAFVTTVFTQNQHAWELRVREQAGTIAGLALLFFEFAHACMFETVLNQKRCRVCAKGDNAEKMLLCDGCDSGFHIFCLRPKLKEIPKGEWWCEMCLLLEAEGRWTRHGVQDARDADIDRPKRECRRVNYAETEREEFEESQRPKRRKVERPPPPPTHNRATRANSR